MNLLSTTVPVLMMSAAAFLPPAVPANAAAGDGPHIFDLRKYCRENVPTEKTTVTGKAIGVFHDYVDKAFVFLVLECDGRFVYTYICTKDSSSVIQRLQPCTGRTVSVSGFRFPANRFREMTQEKIGIISLSDIRILDFRENGSFDIPDLDDPAPTLGELSNPKPRKTTGHVIARWQQSRIILEKPDGQTLIVDFRDGMELPGLGETVEVSGTPVTDLYRINMIHACWRRAGEISASRSEPLPVTIRDLFEQYGRFVFNSRFYGKTIEVKGTLREFVMDESGRRRRLLLENDGFTVQIDCSDAPDALRDIEPGSVVSAAGICVIDTDIWTPLTPFPKSRSLFLVARGNDDIRLIESPAWWTPFRLMVVIAVMSGVIVLFFIWNASLRVLVERRSRQVIKARERKMESELRIGERTRLAADLHDSLSQNLTVIGYQVSNARNTLADKDPATAECIETAAKMIRSCRTDLRRCLWDLRSDVLDEPTFTEAIRRTVTPVADEAALTVRFAGPRTAISDSTAHAVLNILRELVANAVRHGKAQSIQIAGAVDQNRLEASVRDDGCGFDVQSRPRQEDGHFGLDGIIERLERIGGTIAIDSGPGKGTYVRVTITRK